MIAVLGGSSFSVPCGLRGVRVIALSLCENGREVKGFLVISD